MSRRSLIALTIVAAALVAVSIILMATTMAGVFRSFGHGRVGNLPFGSSPLAWTLMIAGMVLGGLGLVAFFVVIVMVLVQATEPRAGR